MPQVSPYSFALNNPVYLTDEDGEIPIIPFLLKATASAAADALLQASMIYLTDDSVKDFGAAFKKIDKSDVAWSFVEGLNPFKVPGGKLGKAAAVATADLLIYVGEQTLDRKEISANDAGKEFMIGFFSELAGDKAGELLSNKKVREKLGDLIGIKELNKLTKKIKPCGCFTAGTKIYTEEGYKNIEEVKAGEKVWAYDENTKKLALKVVIYTFTKEFTQIYRIYFGDETLEVTHEHPFFIGGRWLKVDDLKVGDSLTLYDDTILPIIKIEFIEGNYKVYNFTVDEFHTYYVSKQNVLVHNGNPIARICSTVDSAEMFSVPTT